MRLKTKEAFAMTGITDKDLQHFKTHLLYEEKCRATVEKYLRDLRCFQMA